MQKLKCVGALVSTAVLDLKCLSISWMIEYIFFSPCRLKVQDLQSLKVERSERLPEKRHFFLNIMASNTIDFFLYWYIAKHFGILFELNTSVKM